MDFPGRSLMRLAIVRCLKLCKYVSVLVMSFSFLKDGSVQIFFVCKLPSIMDIFPPSSNIFSQVFLCQICISCALDYHPYFRV
jgi:hypothetical protein